MAKIFIDQSVSSLAVFNLPVLVVGRGRVGEAIGDG